MSDSQHEVKILVTAEVREFQKQMKEAGSSTRDLQKMSTRFRKEGVKGHKDIAAATKHIEKGQKQQIAAAIASEKKLQAEIKNTAKALREKAKMFRGNVDAIQDEVKALHRLEAELAKSKKLRADLGHRSFGERAGGALRSGGSALNRYGGMAAMGLGLGAIGIASRIGGFLYGQVGQAYSAAERFGAAQGALTGMGRPGSYSPRLGEQYGYSMVDTAAQAAGIGRATGNIGAVTQAQALSRGYGMDVGEAGAFMGVLRGAGHQFTGPQGRGGSGSDQLKKVIAAGFESGLERARMPEFIEGVGQLVQTAQRSLAGGVRADGYATLLAMLGRTGQPGMQGAAGAAVLAKIDQGIRTPGGGEAGRAISLQGLGFGIPGSGMSYTEVLERQERGASDPTNVRDMIAETGARFGMGSEAQLIALREMFGIGIGQGRAVVEAYGQGNFDSAFAELQAEMSASKSVEEQGLDQMKDMGKTLKHMAHLENRLVEMGEPVVESIQAMERVLNETIEEHWDTVVDSVKIIAEAVVGINDFLHSVFGTSEVMTRQAAALNAQTESREETLGQLRPQGRVLSTMDREDLIRRHSAASQMLTEATTGIHRAREALPDSIYSTQYVPGQGLRRVISPDTPEERAAYAAIRQAEMNREAIQALVNDLSEALRRQGALSAPAADSAATRTLSAQTTSTGSVPVQQPTPTRARR